MFQVFAPANLTALLDILHDLDFNPEVGSMPLAGIVYAFASKDESADGVPCIPASATAVEEHSAV